MTQPYQIDREAVLRPIVGIENRTAQEVFDIMCDRIRRRPAPMEAVAWREKVVGLIDRHLHGIEHEETTNPDGWWETSRGADFGAKVKADLKDAILALISTHPVQGGEG